MRPLRFEDLTRRFVPGVLGVGAVWVDPVDEGSILALVTNDDGQASLWRWGSSGGEASVVVGPPDTSTPTTADELEAQRLRRAWNGVASVAWAGVDALVVSLDGRYRVVDRAGRPREGYDLEGAIAVATSSRSEVVLASSGREVWVAGPGGRRTLDRSVELSLGLAEYVAAEEFDRHEGLWLSPSGRYAAWSRVDERHVREHVIVHQDVFPETLEHHRYPFVGEANATVSLVVADLATGEVHELGVLPADGYLVEVCWLDDATLMVAHLDRPQQELVRLVARPPRFEVAPFDREVRSPWINLPGDGFGHQGALLTRSERFDGTWRAIVVSEHGARLLTDEYVVTGLVGVVDDALVAIGYRDDARRRSLVRIELSTGRVDALWEGGWVGPAAASRAGLVAVTHTATRPPALERLGPRREVLADSEPVIQLDAPSFVEIDVPGARPRHGAVYLPEGGAAGRPLVLAVYGGPHVQLVQDSWGLTQDLTAQWLRHLGAVVLKLDGRGSAEQGRAFEDPIAAGFGTVELEDTIGALDWAVNELGVNPARVGIYGWSYGGYLTLLSLARYPERFRAGVAGAPVVDFRWYDNGYSERYLGRVDDPRYEQASVLTYLDGLRGPLAPRVLVIHGMLDENVHVGHSLRLLAEAARRGIDIEFVALPSSRHGPRDEATLGVVARRRVGFLAEHLGLRAE